VELHIIQVNLFGTFGLHTADQRAVQLTSKKGQVLLTRLALAQERQVSRERLAALLWGSIGPAQARNSLRQLLFEIRRQLAGCGGDILRIERDAVSLDARRTDIDAARFQALTRRGDYQSLIDAAACYTGDLLENIAAEGEPFEPWLVGQREHLRQGAIRSLRTLLDEHRRRGCVDEAIETAGRLLMLEPLDEATHRALMSLYAEQRRWGAMDRQYHICSAMVRRHLNTEPENATAHLHRQLHGRRRTGLLDFREPASWPAGQSA